MNKELHGVIEYIKTIRGRIEGVFDWLKGGTAVNTTDTVKVTGDVGTDVGFEAVSSNSTGRVYFGVGSGGANHGVYSRVKDDWLIYSDGTDTYVDGKNTENILTAEIGTSGIWTYRKLSDGTAECWGKYTMAFNTCNTPWGSMYYSQPYGNVSLPSGLFISAPVISLMRSGGTEGIVSNSGSPSATVINGMYLTRPVTASAGSTTVSIYCVGKWK